MTELKIYQRDFGSTDREILKRIRPGSRILEVGCAVGMLTQHLRDDLGCRVTAVEINPVQAEISKAYAEKMIVGDITSSMTWSEIADEYDHIIFADVLEHLAYPWETLCRCRGVLKSEGTLLASVPNVAHFSVRLGLLRGRFEYTESGILDSTHLRFFTAKTAVELFTRSGYHVTAFLRLYNPRGVRLLDRILPKTLMSAYKQSRDRVLDRLWPNSHTFRFLVEARGDTPPKVDGNNA